MIGGVPSPIKELCEDQTPSHFKKSEKKKGKKKLNKLVDSIEIEDKRSDIKLNSKQGKYSSNVQVDYVDAKTKAKTPKNASSKQKPMKSLIEYDSCEEDDNSATPNSGLVKATLPEKKRITIKDLD